MAGGINLGVCKPLTDFGQGFYTTTLLQQAKSWANTRCNRMPLRQGIGIATVLQFSIDRDQLAKAHSLFFIIENANRDYWDFVRHCRTNQPTAAGQHQRALAKRPNYGVVAGPVSLWPQSFIMKDCDQISFHTRAGLKVLGKAIISHQATQKNPRF